MKYCTVELWGDMVRFVTHPNGIRGNSPRKKQAKEFLGGKKDYDEDYIEEQERARAGSNISRARSRIRELALCNHWDWFATFTLDKSKQDRFDLRTWVKDFGNWVGNFNRKYKCCLRYVIIAENHKNGAWHSHGLLDGVPESALERNNNGYYSMPYYANRFGYMSLSRVKDHNKCANYVTKYITKDIGESGREKGEHLFYASRGLAGKQPLMCAWVPENFVDDYTNEWCGISWRNSKDIDILELEKNLKEGVIK